MRLDLLQNNIFTVESVKLFVSYPLTCIRTASVRLIKGLELNRNIFTVIEDVFHMEIDPDLFRSALRRHYLLFERFQNLTACFLGRASCFDPCPHAEVTVHHTDSTVSYVISKDALFPHEIRQRIEVAAKLLLVRFIEHRPDVFIYLFNGSINIEFEESSPVFIKKILCRIVSCYAFTPCAHKTPYLNQCKYSKQ